MKISVNIKGGFNKYLRIRVQNFVLEVLIVDTCKTATTNPIFDKNSYSSEVHFKNLALEI